jgi:hypothetical protein
MIPTYQSRNRTLSGVHRMQFGIVGPLRVATTGLLRKNSTRLNRPFASSQPAVVFQNRVQQDLRACGTLIQTR